MKARYVFRLFLVLAIAAPSAATFAQASVLQAVENGDYDGDGFRNLTDAINMFQHLFTGRAQPSVPIAPCEIIDTDDGSMLGRYSPAVRNCDVNGDGSFNLADCVYFLNWLFIGGEEPAEIDCAVLGNSA